MNSMILKVCGLSDNESSRAVAEIAAVTHLGFIFYDKSVRFTTSSFQTTKKKIGVFVNPELNQLLDLAEEHQLNGFQLHGNESPDLVAQLPNDLEIFKAIGISSKADLEKTKEFDGFVSAFLFDTKSPNYGGTGMSFDWSILNSYTGETPFILSGGIGLKNTNEIKLFHHEKFNGLDLNSQFERAPKDKNTNQLKQFISEIQ